MEFRSFVDIRDLISSLPPIDERACEQARARRDSLTKPPGSLGRLEELAAFMAGWPATPRPRTTKARALVFAGNRRVCAQGVNPYPQEVTAQMVQNFQRGKAAINHLCRTVGADLHVVPNLLDKPTAISRRALR